MVAYVMPPRIIQPYIPYHNGLYFGYNVILNVGIMLAVTVRLQWLIEPGRFFITFTYW